MGKVVKTLITAAAAVVGGIIAGPFGALAAMTLTSALIKPKVKISRQASVLQVQLGEVPRQMVFGETLVAGSLVDVFNYGGTNGTDWECMVLALADHRCHSLTGFYVNDVYVAFAGDGMVAGYNNQLQVHFRSGTETQIPPSILTTNGPGWTANDNGAGVCHVVVAYKADDPKQKTPVWPGGRPRFTWLLKGKLCYDARKDSTVAGGSGSHRVATPSTWEWSDNAIVCRDAWVRGVYACDRVGQPSQLLVGRGLSAVEAPLERVAAPANVCDELAPLTAGGSEKRYRADGIILASDTFVAVEQQFASACAGVILQMEGTVEVEPGQAKSAVFFFTDADLVVGTQVRSTDFPSEADDEWINTVIPRYIEPAQKFAEHSAPVRRVVDDLIADGGPREETLTLSYVTRSTQAGRIGEIVRRQGRLWKRRQVTLGPRFAEIEAGDWGVWTSDTYLNGASVLFRVDVANRSQDWRMALVLRQMAESVYDPDSDLASTAGLPPDPAPSPIDGPGAGSWAASFAWLTTGGQPVPALVVAGAVDNDYAHQVRFETWADDGVTDPEAVTSWTAAGVAGAETTRFEIGTVALGASYHVRVSYLIAGIPSDPLIIGPVQAGQKEEAYNNATSYGFGRVVNKPDGSRYVYINATASSGHAPPNLTYWAELTPPMTPAGIGAASLSALDALALTAAGKSTIFYRTTPPTHLESVENDRWVDLANGNKEYRRVAGTGRLAIGSDAITLGGNYLVLCWTPADDSRISQAITDAAGAQATADGKIVTFNQEETPVAEGLGDLWLKPSTGIVKRWDGASWVDHSSLGAPAGTMVAGKLAEDVESELDAATESVTRIASDGWLTAGEKPQLVRDHKALVENHAALHAKAVALGQGVAERAAATAAINALNVYLTGLSPTWNNTASDTEITGATLTGLFDDAVETVAALLVVIQGIPGADGAPGSPGSPGSDGVDGIDGVDGKLVEFVWKRAASAPAAPTGNGIPATWFDDPPAGSNPLWFSKVKQELDGTLVSGEAWSTPVRHDGPPGVDGSDGADGAPGPTGVSSRTVYQRSAAQPSTPSPSADTPAGWYASTADVPAGAQPMWALPGERAAGGTNYTWGASYRAEAVSIVSTGQSVPLPASPSVSSTLSFVLPAGGSRVVYGQGQFNEPTGTGVASVELEYRQSGGGWTGSSGDGFAYAVGEPLLVSELNHSVTVTNTTGSPATFEARGNVERTGTNSGPIHPTLSLLYI